MDQWLVPKLGVLHHEPSILEGATIYGTPHGILKDDSRKCDPIKMGCFKMRLHQLARSRFHPQHCDTRHKLCRSVKKTGSQVLQFDLYLVEHILGSGAAFWTGFMLV